MNKLLLYFLLIAFLSSCSSDTSELETRISELELALDECQNGADKVFGKLKNAFDNENHEEVVLLYATLLDKHPGSIESINAKAIANQSTEIIDRTKVEKEAEKERLEKEKNEIEERGRKAKLASLNKLKKDHDDISGNTWYKQPYFTHYTNTNRVSIYTGTNGSNVWMNLMMSYEGEDWIFYKNAYLSYDGNTKEIVFDDYRDKKTDNGGGSVWEWITLSDIDSSLISFLEELAKSPNAKVRFSGKYTKTRTLTANERKGITDVINGYKVLKMN